MAVLKKEFIDRMAEIGGITKKDARRGLELFVETLMIYMAENEIVRFTGFGKFEMKTTKERKGLNPFNGTDCIVPEHKKMKFYASEVLADKIKELQRED
jgi:nucleoid DNA-binding protein